MAMLDRIFISTEWKKAFPLVKVTNSATCISDHTPLFIDTGDNCFLIKKSLVLKSGGLRELISRRLYLRPGLIARWGGGGGSSMDRW
jgi:hypothetical protein